MDIGYVSLQDHISDRVVIHYKHSLPLPDLLCHRIEWDQHPPRLAGARMRGKVAVE